MVRDDPFAFANGTDTAPHLSPILLIGNRVAEEETLQAEVVETAPPCSRAGEAVGEPRKFAAKDSPHRE